MKLSLDAGTYVVAVSGGVDSMVLLDILRNMPSMQLVVAHYDHGIRVDSVLDRELVRSQAERHSLEFAYEAGRLGANASEALARTRRYDFLKRIQHAYGADSIITAHHQDDVIETAIVNMLRGTGRKGITSLGDTVTVRRPMLHVSKQEILAYAKTHDLLWREDSTNSDERYLRNYIRLRLLPRFDASAKKEFITLIDSMRVTNADIDTVIDQLLGSKLRTSGLDRRWFLQLSHVISKEILASWLRSNGITSFDAKALERILTDVKTHKPGVIIDVKQGVSIQIMSDVLALVKGER